MAVTAMIKEYENRQAVFDAVVAGMKKQKKVSSCFYLNPDGTMCAIGMLLGKAFVKKHIGNSDVNYEGVGSLMNHLKSLKKSGGIETIPKWLSKQQLRFLDDLQDANDSASSMLHWYTMMSEFAVNYKLKRDKLDKVDWGSFDAASC